MEAYVYWFVLALVFLVAEMASGTFYFLALSIAMALGGIAAHLGPGLSVQYSVAGVAAVAGTLALRQLKKSRRAVPDVGLDVGQPVKVLAWNADGSARVQYRGAEWDAEPESSGMAREATLYIKAIQGSKLILSQHKPKLSS